MRGREAQYLRLVGHVERHAANAPQHEHRKHRAHAAERSGHHKRERERHAGERDANVPIAPALAHVEAREQKAADNARHAKHHERGGDGLVGKPAYLLQIGLHVAVTRVIGRGNDGRAHKQRQQHRVFHQAGKLAYLKRLARTHFRHGEEEHHEQRNRERRDASECHAPAERQADDASQGQTENLGD